MSVNVVRLTEISIVAVHGLDGHYKHTFEDKNGTLWLKDLLPKYVPDTRILTYGYDSRTHGRDPIANQFLFQQAATFLTKLVSYRDDTNVSSHSSSINI